MLSGGGAKVQLVEYLQEEFSRNNKLIEFITIATTGNAQDFGDLILLLDPSRWCATSSIRACILVVVNHPSPVNCYNIEFVTIATTGNGTRLW